MGKLVIGTGMMLVGVFMCFTVVLAIPGTIMAFLGGGMMFAGFASVTKSTVKGGMAAGKIARDMRANREGVTTIEAQPVAPSRSVADEIAKLADLLNAGHLTQAEFDQRKGQLLSQA